MPIRRWRVDRPVDGGSGAAVSVEVLITTHVMGLDRERGDAWPLSLVAGTVPLCELIRAKVTREVAEYAAGRRRMVGKEYLMLDELAAFQEAVLRGRAMHLVVEEEVRKACKAFEEGDYMVTVGGREVHDLDAVLTLEPGARIQFLRLLPVAGGAPWIAAGERLRRGARAPGRRGGAAR